jgi:hypothetical protein
MLNTLDRKSAIRNVTQTVYAIPAWKRYKGAIALDIA